MTNKNLLVELFVEELPPKALNELGQAFASELYQSLRLSRLVYPQPIVGNAPDPEPQCVAFASPRRLAVHIRDVQSVGEPNEERVKLMPVSVGIDAAGSATPALLKKLAALGADASAVAALERAMDGKAEALFYERVTPGVPLADGLQKALAEAISRLPIPKVMTYQLESGCALPGWSSVSFVRPAHGLVALHGAEVIAVEALGLQAGNSTHGHRFEATVHPVVLKDADSYAQQLREEGAVIASFDERKEEIRHQLTSRAPEGYFPLTDPDGGIDAELLDEVTALVERPNVLVCEFEKEFLGVPQECLILTMKANQKYFPLLDATGKLTNQFLIVSNISPADASAVIGGNERVVRPRLADAKFFFDQDRKKSLTSRVSGLSKVVYHNKLGSQGDRIERVRNIARHIANLLHPVYAPVPQRDVIEHDLALMKVDQAAQLAKTDLVTDMVGEFPELQGTMGRYYALNDGLATDVADAIEDHYKPRFAGDTLPRSTVGVVVALADKLETLVGMFGIGNLPTGDRDPFALRRHALGVIRMLVEKNLPLDVATLLPAAYAVFGDKLPADGAAATEALTTFIFERLAGSLREQGYSAQEVDAVLALRPQRLGDVPQRLAAVRAFAALPEAPALAAANKRIGNILKKADGTVDPHVSEVLLQEPAEKALYAAMQVTLPQAQSQFDAGDYTASLQTLAALRVPVDAYFDGVMVNAEALDVRLNRLGTLKSLHDAMNRVADLARIAS